MVLAHNINEGNRTKDIHINQDVTFDNMLLTPCTLQGLKDSGFYKPSPIQLHGIPLGKCGFDLLLEAKSGTGKTAVFSVIALEKLDLSKGLQVIILAPTREIAMQICDVLKQIGAMYKGLCIEVVMGGLSIKDDIEKFKNNVHIVVASPGRLKHLIQDKYIDTTAVRLFVLDEADKLMEKSFQTDINYIHLALPKQKQVIMSSATYSESSKDFINKYVHNAQHVCPDSNSILLGIEQKVTFVKYNSNIVKLTQNKFKELIEILTNRQFKQCLIFCNYQARVGEIHKMLTREKWPAEQLYGQQEQTERLGALKTLQEYKCRLLICTDLAARGIDATNVDLVINFEPPFEWQTYLHRIGRAGRFGSYGTAVTILSEGIEQNKFKNLLKTINLPFYLTDLWTEEEFCIDDSNSINQLQHEHIYDKCLKTTKTPSSNFKEVYVKLWNVLTDDDKEIKCIESFDKLHNSFSKKKESNKIELFSELLESFTTIQQNGTTDGNEFKQVSVLQLPLNVKPHITRGSMCSKNIERCLDNIKIHENYDNGERERLKTQVGDDNLPVIASVDSTRDINVTNLKHKAIQKKKKINMQSDEVNHDTKSGCVPSETNSVTLDNNSKCLYKFDINNKSSKKYSTNDLIYKNTIDGLAIFGIPTSFSSSVPNCTKPRHNIDSNLKTSHNRFDYHQCKKTTKIEKRTNQHDGNKHSHANKLQTEIEHMCERSGNRHKYTYQIDETEVHNKYVYINRNDVKKGNEKYLNMSKSLNHGLKTSKTSLNNQQYADWYSKLKIKVKQVETFLYINEISKL